jgi:hypothetical protein
MQHGPSWEANRFSVNQEIPCILCNLKVHYSIHKRPPPVPILSQLDPVHIPISYYLHPKSHLCLNLPSDLFSSRFHTKTLYTPLFSPISATCLAHVILLDFITGTILGDQMVDGRLESRLRGYHLAAPRPINCRPFVHRLCSSTRHLQRRSTPSDMGDLC